MNTYKNNKKILDRPLEYELCISKIMAIFDPGPFSKKKN